MEVQPEETLPMLKDHLVTRETMLVSNVVNKDTLLVIALKGSDATITTPISSILTTMTKSTMITTPHSNPPTLSMTSRLDLLISLETTKPN